VTLANGRVVSNPLATPVRFEYQTRGEGRFALPGLHIWNVRLTRQLERGTRRVDATLDVFNVTNRGADQG
jgi:hypothetical protein